ncbi:uncharacterized protein J8A68_000227 [[Candida] subhashii]|uniref:Putative lipoate-protein ligase A n=1 Tax=[Candida] subhashii TaxID=561895 RepID=A0A8J5QWY5_9ASCO|nr:uncharacterized protein J8A68_000227 [[Candida] subhashii]KAG7666232.1 hypothetical protein J8A68_000227 [[Candida] subhashii]
MNLPFQDELTPGDMDDFGLGDFQHYQPSPDTLKQTLQDTQAPPPPQEQEDSADLTSLAQSKQPLVFISKFTDPYLNLALEDFIYTQMPKPDPTSTSNYNRLMFYINTPCVVIGKNQNPWKEVNLPLLNSLKIPLLRRRSGGGTVVHDLGNVNYSFMTTKDKFDRFSFANLITTVINNIVNDQKKIMVNERGDIVTKEGGFKISGSAYKLAKGKSYHHGTMLLNSNLEVLKKLLHRDESKLGIVDAMNSISSVKSKVINLGLESEKFISAVSDEFQNEYGLEVERKQPEPVEQEEDEYDQDELFGFNQFVGESERACKVITVSDESLIPQEVHETARELREWNWRFGNTPKFTHTLMNDQYGFQVKFIVDRHAIIEALELTSADESVQMHFKYLEEYIKEHKGLEYTGSNIAGYITHDEISDWIGQSIDGSI